MVPFWSDYGHRPCGCMPEVGTPHTVAGKTPRKKPVLVMYEQCLIMFFGPFTQEESDCALTAVCNRGAMTNKRTAAGGLSIVGLLISALLSVACGDDCDEASFGSQCGGNGVQTCHEQEGTYGGSSKIETVSCGELTCSTFFGAKSAMCLPPDVVKPECSLKEVLILENNAEGTGHESTIESIVGVGMVDQKLLVASQVSDGTMHLYSPTDGKSVFEGNFSAAVSYGYVGDSNGDSLPDFAASLPGDGSDSLGVGVLYHSLKDPQSSAYTFESATLSPDIHGGLVAYADLDADGEQDTIFVGEGQVAVYWGLSGVSQTLWSTPEKNEQTRAVWLKNQSNQSVVWASTLNQNNQLSLYKLELSAKEIKETEKYDLGTQDGESVALSAIDMGNGKTAFALSTESPSQLILFVVQGNSVTKPRSVKTVPLDSGTYAINKDGKAAFVVPVASSAALAYIKEDQDNVTYLIDSALRKDDGGLRTLRWLGWPQGDNPTANPYFSGMGGALYELDPKCLP